MNTSHDVSNGMKRCFIVIIAIALMISAHQAEAQSDNLLWNVADTITASEIYGAIPTVVGDYYTVTFFGTTDFTSVQVSLRTPDSEEYTIGVLPLGSTIISFNYSFLATYDFYIPRITILAPPPNRSLTFEMAFYHGAQNAPHIITETVTLTIVETITITKEVPTYPLAHFFAPVFIAVIPIAFLLLTRLVFSYQYREKQLEEEFKTQNEVDQLLDDFRNGH